MKTKTSNTFLRRLASVWPFLRVKAALAELWAATQPLLFYWNEWVHSDACTLNGAEIRFIKTHIDRDFSFSFYNLIMPSYKIACLWHALKRLDASHRAFKEFVIGQFLLKLIALRGQYGSELFWDLPVYLLDISAPLKASFKSFGVLTARELFFAYDERRLNQCWVYQRIVKFHTLLKSEKQLLTPKPIPPMIKSKAH